MTRSYQLRSYFRLALFASLLLPFLFFVIPSADGQELPPPIPPSADPTAGLQTFNQRCANCHGPLGLGDGELAVNLPNPPPAIGSLDYLATADPAAMFAIIEQGNLLAGMPAFGPGDNSDPLDPQQIWDVIASLYLLDQYSKPIDTAKISGRVVNGTTGEVLANTPTILQAFTPDFTPAFQQETTTDADGRYTFDLSNIPPSWFYRAVANHNGLDFTSDIAPLTPFITDIALPVTVYESTTSDTAVSISQLEIIYTFGDNLVQVAEFYTFDHDDPAVYVGDSGNYIDGAIRIAFPENAENITILRNVGGITDFVPMDEQTIVTSPTERRVAWPLPPGQGGLRLLVRYTFPYGRALDLTHPLPYPAHTIEALLPDNNVTLDGWTQQETIYSETNDPSLSRITFTPPVSDQPLTELTTNLRGFPTLIFDEQGIFTPTRDEQQELLIGGLSLAIILIVTLWLAYTWRTTPPLTNDLDDLLYQLAALDLAHQEKKIGRATHRRRRTQLKSQIESIWPS